VTQVAPFGTYSYGTSTTTAFVVQPGAAARLQLLVQGETAVPGSGKSGTWAWAGSRASWRASTMRRR
jgi:hypothetical protein